MTPYGHSAAPSLEPMQESAKLGQYRTQRFVWEEGRGLRLEDGFGGHRRNKNYQGVAILGWLSVPTMCTDQIVEVV